METIWMESGRGYQIPFCCQVEEQEKLLIICHGFGSSQRSPTVLALHEWMPKWGFGTISFDFPAHGESPVDGAHLRVPNCLEDLACVERCVSERYPGRTLCYFGSSFGAYITLNYLATYPHAGNKAFLRSAAVDMHGIVSSWLEDSKPEWQKSEDGDPMQDYFAPDYDYGRPMKITRALLEDLRQHNLFTRYPQQNLSLKMIHGSADSTAPAEDAKRFAAQAGAELILLPGAEHRLMGEGEMARVIREAGDFLAR